MNAERLLEIATDIRDDLTDTNAAALVQEMATHLQNSINQPNQPPHEQQFNDVYTRLRAALESAASNDFSPAWRETAAELGAEGLLGRDLLSRIEGILSQNEITKQIAVEALQQLHKPLEKLRTGTIELVASLEKLGFEPYALEPGEGELRIVVPRSFVDDQLDQLGREMGRLNFIFGRLGRLAGAEIDGFRVRAIGSSEFEILLSSSPLALWIFGKCVDKILGWIKESLTIATMWNDLKSRDVPVPENILEDLKSHANDLVDKQISTLREELLAEHPVDPPKGEAPNEFGNSIEAALKELAARIDRGFQVEVRVEALPEPDDEEELDEQAQAVRHAISSISEIAPRLLNSRPEGDPILELPDELPES